MANPVGYKAATWGKSGPCATGSGVGIPGKRSAYPFGPFSAQGY
jgi:hypothetical protein